MKKNSFDLSFDINICGIYLHGAMYNFVTVQGDSLQNQEKNNSRLHHVIKIDAQATQLILLCTTTTNITSSCCLKDYRSIFF